MTLTFNPLRAMVMVYSHTKLQGQRSIGSEDSVETNGQTDGGEHITSLTNGVGKHLFPLENRQPRLYVSIICRGT